MEKIDTIKLLVICDDPDKFAILSATVCDTLPEVHLLSATNDLTGIAIAAIDDPDVILLDIAIPGIDSFAVCRRFKADERTKDTPVVFLTAQTTAADLKVKALTAGAEGFLAEPVEAAELTAQIKTMAKVKEACRSQWQGKDDLEALGAEGMEAKEVIADSEKKFRLAFMTSPDSININRMSDGKYIEVNEGFLRIMGYKREEVIGRTSTELAIWNNPEDRKRLVNGLQTDGYVENLSTQFCRADGTILEGLMSAGVIELQGEQCILSITRDITKHKQTERSLRKSEERFQLAMNASHDGLFDWNLETNDIYYSPAWKKILGYEDHELPNDFSIWENTTDPADVKKSWDLQQKLISKQIDRFVMEFKMKHKDGHWVDILSRAEAIFNDNGKAIRMIGTHTDITERKQAELKLKQQTTQLEQRNRALRQFNYAVSHELKTPLVSIESSLGLIQSSLPQTMDSGLTNVFGYARTATRQMNSLLESLLLIFRIDAADSDTESTTFRVLVQDAIGRLTRGNKLEGIKVTVAEEGPELCGDLHKLVQIWLHLIGNAAKYMGDQKHPAIDIGVEHTNQEVVFYVRDNGVGIEQAYQGKIFGLFDQLDKTTGGTGLGLTLVQRIVNYYGGTIRVESAGTGQGSCFYFTLPDLLINKVTAAT